MRLAQSAILTVSAALLAAVPERAEAQTCGGNSFKTCATVSISTSTIGNEVQVVMYMMNNSGYLGTFGSTVFTSFGLFGLPTKQGNQPAWSYVANSFSATGSGSWTLGTNGLSGSGITASVAGGQANNGINGGIVAPQWVQFTFRLSGITQSQINAASWAIHGQGGPNGCSTKLVVTNGVANNGPYDALNCRVDPVTGIIPTSVTPEPASIALLGTGLAGLAGVARRRRRGSK